MQSIYFLVQFDNMVHAERSNVKHLIIPHHDPDHDDEFFERDGEEIPG
jgi:hypothetical protein